MLRDRLANEVVQRVAQIRMADVFLVRKPLAHSGRLFANEHLNDLTVEDLFFQVLQLALGFGLFDLLLGHVDIVRIF